MSVVDRSFDHPLKPEERASAPLAGGIMRGFQCGMLWGAALAAGAQAYRLLGPGPQAETEAIVATQRLVETFRTRNKYIDCLDITGIEMGSSSKRRLFMQVFRFFLLKGGPINCFRMAAGYAPAVFSEINTTFSEKRSQTPSGSVSCAAMLAQKMGVSDMHTVMAAGLAGGIGLSGSACGALGAAVWIIGMNFLKEGAGEDIWSSPVFQSRVNDTIDRFLQCTHSEFRCSKIVGRRFENAAEHAAHLSAGGCSKIIEVLAAHSD